MAEKGWTARIATAAGAAAGTGAAQLGLGYGLGVVVWPVTPTPDDSAWLGSLGWATWITASATVFGAVLGSRYRGGPGPRTSAAWRFALAACAAVGALVTVALIALPARSAVRFDAYSPQVIAGGYAAVGLALGLVVAFWAVSSRPVAANLMATGVWLWALAVAAIVVELTTNRDSATYLTSWQFAEVASSGRYGTIYWPSALLTLGAAFLVGALTATPAARRGDRGVGAATSGAAGPLLVAIAFLALAPRLTGALGPIESAYLIAPYAVLAGLAGSALAVTTTRALAERRARRAQSQDPQSPNQGLQSRGLQSSDQGLQSSAAATAPSPRPALDPPPAHPQSATTPTGVAKVQEAPPAKPKTGLFGRIKSAPPKPKRPAQDIPTQPTPGAPPATNTKPVPDARPVPNAKPAPTAQPAPTVKPGSAVKSAPAVKSTPDKADKPAPAQPTNGRPAGPVVDAEIASAARPRPRPRKAATPSEPPKAPKSTVTPPPSAPTVAQINPKPTSKD
ncbi:Hansenula MRAKII killer toxin-resistant protein 1 [Actinoplanes sp. TRM 88003]|uniref:Hansenula MRAKII killer toxin-resistant protein 1 n=1 Tax=Paractinoplanes aksuensis TaxID=2939490 RepID=A0ABT1E6Z5_9ACTN|nr:Hansenula MRAKII killer toxin-resistant protein 1 [Actinoplanes aksuensis]MCO8277586.1 Hansenula MRAKII killer toxin-resistant protein 1 [Actinoplanes aksuensis]